MISRQNRFHGHNALNFVYRTGQTVRGEFLSLKYAPSRTGDYRLAIVVSKKVSKSAVVRNRVRRRIYEVVRVLKQASGQSWPYDLVITVFDERIATMPSADLQDSIKRLLQKASLH